VTRHEIVNPPELLPPVGFSHAVVAASGRTVFLGGQTAHQADGSLPPGGIVEQFAAAAANVVIALRAAGARPDHVVSLTIYVTDAEAYRGSLRDIGTAYRKHLGRHFPAMALFEIRRLFDPRALVELVALAVIPED
jgi:enamine deaminase RidA (YjgF/YER057c/UK114 family)